MTNIELLTAYRQEMHKIQIKNGFTDEQMISYRQGFMDAIREYEQRIATDVQPVKHGTWRKDEQGYDVYVECSECGLNLSTSNYIENEWRETLKYCPCCGARMDGDTE